MTKRRTAYDFTKLWDLNAKQYAANTSKYGDRNKEVLTTPLILDKLGNLDGKKILDAGCGEGYLSRLLAERGAIVTGIDFSERLLEIARERTPEDLRVEYLHANLENLSQFSDGIFDVIVSCLAIQDVPDHKAAIQELYRVMKSDGVCILVITHPCFTSDGGWIRDSEGNKLYWKIDNYFDEREIEMLLDPKSDHNPIGFHRTLTNYYKSINNAGFVIDDLIEPYPSQEVINNQPNFKDDLRMCHFLLFILWK